MIASFRRLKTSFVIKQKLMIDARFTDGWLAMTQQVDIPSGLTADLSQSIENAEKRRLGKLNLLDENNQVAFYFTRSNAFDARGTAENYLEMPFTIDGNRIDYYVPVNWLNDQKTLYPVTIDPYVYSGD